MPSARSTPVSLLVALVGAALFAFTIRQVGWSTVVAGIAGVGWAFLAVVALGALRFVARSCAWVACANQVARSRGESAHGADSGAGLSVGGALSAMLAGDALGNLTPLGLLASEPAKILLSRSRMSTVTSVASVAIENVLYTLSVAAVLLSGTWLLLQRANTPPALEVAAEVVVVGAAVASLVAMWAARTRPAVLSAIAPFISRLAGRASVSADTMSAVEAQLYGALRWSIGRVVAILGWEALFHVGAVAEVWIVLRLLPGGAGITVTDAFLMESAGRFVTVAFKFIPYRLGVDEAGSGAVARVLGLNPALGVTLALVRRLRILVLNAAGLILLARRR